MKVYMFLKNLFYRTAWTMVPPKPYSRFHILLTASGALSAVLFAAYFSGQTVHKEAAGAKETFSGHILFSCGLLLAAMEICKQGFLFFIENDGRFNWWYFPFQLCSVPMYLCLGWPLLRSDALKKTFAGFIQDFGLLGGIMALAVPPGLMHPYWIMTLHGFIWHFILIFLGLYCAMSRLTDFGPKGFLRILPLFFVCCLIAIAINVLAGPGADADMFYLSPYHPSSQPVFHRISVILGILPGMLLYILSMVLGGFLVHSVLKSILS